MRHSDDVRGRMYVLVGEEDACVNSAKWFNGFSWWHEHSLEFNPTLLFRLQQKPAELGCDLRLQRQKCEITIMYTSIFINLPLPRKRIHKRSLATPNHNECAFGAINHIHPYLSVHVLFRLTSLGNKAIHHWIISNIVFLWYFEYILRGDKF